MKLAVMILAHKNLEQLKRLIRALSHDKIDVFIHMDKKWTLSEDDLMGIRQMNKEQIVIVDESISAQLDSWSLIQATMSLVTCAKAKEKKENFKYMYFALLSGQDYPIKKIDYILESICKQYPKVYLDVTPYAKTNWLYHKFKRVDWEEALNGYINQRFSKGLLRRLVKLPGFLMFLVVKQFYSLRHEFHWIGCDLYGGSAWWILPDVSMEFVLENYKTDESKFLQLMKKVKTPEEVFFQTLVMQSDLASHVVVNSADMMAQNCMTFAYFSDVNKPFCGHPCIFKSENFESLINLPHFFARKFDFEVNQEIFDLLDEYQSSNY